MGLFETVIVSIQECNIERAVAKPSITYSPYLCFPGQVLVNLKFVYQICLSSDSSMSIHGLLSALRSAVHKNLPFSLTQMLEAGKCPNTVREHSNMRRGALFGLRSFS